MFERYERLAARALADEAPSEADAHWILDGPDVALLPLLHAAFAPRERYFGRRVMVHVLNNVQNGLCPEDCGYCSQSRDSSAAIRKYAMKSDDEILAGAESAATFLLRPVFMEIQRAIMNVTRPRKQRRLWSETLAEIRLRTRILKLQREQPPQKPWAQPKDPDDPWADWHSSLD